MFHHIEAAAAHWQRGDKALANFRLVFAGLPRLADLTDAYRLQAAEYLLDAGMAPRELLTELGLDASALDLGKYDPDQPRVPPGSGRDSGRWDVAERSTTITGSPPDSSRSDRAIVATNVDDKKLSDESGLASPSEAVPHVIQINPLKDTVPGQGYIAGLATKIAPHLEAIGGGVPRVVPTPKGAMQFIFPNGTVLRFDLRLGQYLPTAGPHLNLQFVPGATNPNRHIPVKP